MAWALGDHDNCVGVCAAIGQNDPRFVVDSLSTTPPGVRLRANVGGKEFEVTAVPGPANSLLDAKIGVCIQLASNQQLCKRDGRPSDFEPVVKET
jgi:hypothetical protein